MPDYCYTGLPQWHHPDWGQSALHGSRQTTPLARYASHFSSVEGNSTFYALPDADTVQRWDADTPADFRFCFKLPRRISHDLKLRHCDTELRTFFDCLAPLGAKLGLLYLQFPANFGPDALPRLTEFLRQLPGDFRYGVEVRHPAFFAKGEEERALNRLLMETGVNRTLFDTRALFALPADDAETQEALQKKPRVPLHVIATGQAPMVRFITPLDYHAALDWLDPWVGKVNAWLDEGRTPFIFFHTPDNAQSPELARLFNERLAAVRAGVRGFKPWPDSLRQQETLF
ncbi:hypothetical protein GCM10011348_22840 [Marinobacterium nitratireducens]|uniref:DUF72 domain-containing protein n=1 Tax=Marinobacterium nitratireducens TaxID=518897 RepID=A0A917ZF96_9GAMM|nr:DUF72 domain-containing protein [Marinobacterium nitratireducens]GGO82143.1 hypothetical protein GCM10011348_22840 [Marinobacterium nitratireducens]